MKEFILISNKVIRLEILQMAIKGVLNVPLFDPKFAGKV